MTAIEPTKLMRVATARFNCMLLDGAFALAIARLMAARIHRLYAALDEKALKPGPGQIARRLLWLARGDAGPAAQLDASLHVSHEALAMMLGTTRQTVAKRLGQLAAAGCVVQRYGRIEITSMNELMRIAAECESV